ncbi:MAG TPA: class I SAM-dependent methyltransferase [Thermoanaerobaculia bacterium]|nr:class I SAM-dependent methyltransferase [Thermoanaerobaculia bacterium]
MSFYDDFTPFYHLIFQDWDASIARQGEQLKRLVEAEWPGHETVLDVSCGIGTQSIALARQGFQVTSSDLSPAAVERAGRESAERGVSISFSVCDMRNAYACHGGGFDLVISCDNSVPHLLDDGEILRACREMYVCLRPGGGCLISVRDYDQEPRGRNLVKPYGVREENGKRYLPFQIWDFEGENYYDFTLFLVEEDLSSREVKTHTLRSRYYAVSPNRLLGLLEEAGFQKVAWRDEGYYQPVLIGTRP